VPVSTDIQNQGQFRPCDVNKPYDVCSCRGKVLSGKRPVIAYSFLLRGKIPVGTHVVTMRYHNTHYVVLRNIAVLINTSIKMNTTHVSLFPFDNMQACQHLRDGCL